MKLEPNMYVRTKYGDVFILDKIEDNHLIPRYIDIPYIIIEQDVKKASHSIIDLIQVGDYVNGSEVVFKDFNNLNEECLECGIGDYMVCSYEAKDIKSIVTKEQFESMSYKVGE